MAESKKAGAFTSWKPDIEYTEDGKLKAKGHCLAKGDELDCYGWEEDDVLMVLDTMNEEESGIPENMYYCYNSYRNDSAWVTENQVEFDFGSRLAE